MHGRYNKRVWEYEKNFVTATATDKFTLADSFRITASSKTMLWASGLLGA